MSDVEMQLILMSDADLVTLIAEVRDRRNLTDHQQLALAEIERRCLDLELGIDGPVILSLPH